MTVKLQRTDTTGRTSSVGPAKDKPSKGATLAALAGLRAPGRKGVHSATTRRAATKLLEPIAHAEAHAPKEQKKAKAAAAFVDALSPKAAAGFRYSIDGYEALPGAAKAVLSTFARVRDEVAALAHGYGVGEGHAGTNPSGLNPRDVEAALNQALKPFHKQGSDAAAILTAAAKKTSDGNLGKHLLATAELWSGRDKNPGWKAALALRDVDAPVRNSIDERIADARGQAKAEWLAAPVLSGHGTPAERRELYLPVDRGYSPEFANLNTTPDHRSFTREGWMAARVPTREDLLESDRLAAMRIPDARG